MNLTGAPNMQPAVYGSPRIGKCKPFDWKMNEMMSECNERNVAQRAILGLHCNALVETFATVPCIIRSTDLYECFDVLSVSLQVSIFGRLKVTRWWLHSGKHC